MMSAATRKSNLTAERLREVLHYDPDTGEFTRLISFPHAPAGSKAGCLQRNRGYIVIRIDGRLYTGHRLAWLYMTGIWPPIEVDHRDTNRTNNRWLNLRTASSADNAANKKKHYDNRIGFKGVQRNHNRFSALIMRHGKRIHLGTYDTKEEAHAAYVAASRKLHGEFGRAS